jgi:hypothetical protein
MMIARVPPSALSDLHTGLRLAGLARPLARLQERRAARAAARGRSAAPRHSAAPAGLGRPRSPRRADPAPAGKAATTPAGYARHRAPVAPSPGHPEVDLPPDGTASSPRRNRRADPAARHREQRLGGPADPGRAAEARPSGGRVHDPPGPQGVADPSGSEAAHRYDVAAVPARASVDDACGGLLSRGLRSDTPPLVLLVRDGRLAAGTCTSSGSPRTRTGRGPRGRSGIF